MVLMQIALMDMPNIAGYYGNSAPLFNRWKNITHTEIGLFNSLDYPLRLIKNAKYATCNQDTLTEQFKREIFFAVFLNLRYHKESQLAFVPSDSDRNIYVERNIIADFMSSDKKKLFGGRKPTFTEEIKLPILGSIFSKDLPTELPQQLPQQLPNSFVDLVNEFNKLFPEYSVDPKEELVQSIYGSIYFNMVPTSGQLEDLEINKINVKKEKQC